MLTIKVGKDKLDKMENYAQGMQDICLHASFPLKIRSYALSFKKWKKNPFIASAPHQDRTLTRVTLHTNTSQLVLKIHTEKLMTCLTST